MHKKASSILCAQWTLNIVSQKCHQTSAKICLNHEEIEKIKEGISGLSAVKGKQIEIFPELFWIVRKIIIYFIEGVPGYVMQIQIVRSLI